MKKIWTALLTIAIVMTAGVSVMAGTFDGYWDFAQGDGTYAYGFPRVLIAMDKIWYRNTRVILGENGQTVSFYHRGSYNAYEKKGMSGGLLFTLGASVNTDFQDLPHVVYLGFDEEEAMNYYAALPTDYQAYMGDAAIRNEYDELWSGVEDVLATAVIKGSEKFREHNERQDDCQSGFLTSGDYYYQINDGTAVIVKYNGDEEEIKIPTEIDGYRVTEIGARAYWGKEMESLLIPDGISRIGEQAFECCKITKSLELPENVTISYEAFSDARQLPGTITIPAGTTVEECAFSYCDTVAEVYIGPGAVMKNRAFCYCDALNQVVCEHGSRLEAKSFEYCKGLGRVILYGDIVTEEDAFLFCGDIEVTEEEADASGDHSRPAPEAPAGGAEADPNEASPRIITAGDYDYYVSEGVVTIVKYNGDDADVQIPSEIDGCQVAQIGDEAFRYRNLKSISFPASVHSIGQQAFEYCEITDMLQLPENAVISEDAFSYAVLPPVVIIPAGATVEECAFSYCEAVEQICLEPDVTIKSRAFGYCDDLLVTVCAEGCVLGDNAFEYCRGMEKAFLCGDVKTEEESFYSCGDVALTEAEAGEYDALKHNARDELLNTAPYEEEERILAIMNSPAAQDGVTVTLNSAEAQRQGDPDRFEYSFGGFIENNSNEGIMLVTYTFALIDEKGEEFHLFSEVYDGEDAAIPPHTAIEFTLDGIRWGSQSIPAAVKIDISSVKTETELPPVHLPKTGQFLYQALGDEKLSRIKEEPPVELSFHVDQGGYGRTATFTEGETLAKAVALLCAIQIGEESGEWVTDNYNWIGLKWADGSRTGISLNLNNLECRGHSVLHTFELEHLDAFWLYCAGYLEEDAD